MTLDELKKSKEVLVTVNDIALILGMDPQSIRSMAKSEPQKLGFPVTVVGSRVKVPRKPFLKFLGEE